MAAFMTGFFHNTWTLAVEMAPYLLFGFAAAGLLHILLRADYIKRILGKPGLGGVVKAAVLGVPMPLCSCSVIPVAASLRRSGASRGATASFLSSTPQTGIDSIMATYSLLGGLFTVVRVLVAFVCGIVTGALIEILCKQKPKSPVPEMADMSFTPMAPAEATSPPPCACSKRTKHGWREGIRYACITLPSDLANALILGLLLAGLITTLLPSDLLHGSLSSGPLAFLLATAISLPLYICATASIPMAYALMAAGLSSGAALVFLITGPATNTATVVTVWKMLGRTPTMIYLCSLLAISWLAGALLNASVSEEMSAMSLHHGEQAHTALWQHLSAVALIGLLVFNRLLAHKKKKMSCHRAS